MAMVRRKPRHLEHKEAEAYVRWFRQAHPRYVELMWHTPNERKDATEARLLSAAGVAPGVPDFTIAVPARGFHGAYLELKRTGAVPSSVSVHQRAKLDALTRAGYYAHVCFGLDEIMYRTSWYLGTH